MASPNKTSDTLSVSFQLKQNPDARSTRAIFQVPRHLVRQLTQNPILCCGGIFDLMVLVDDNEDSTEAQIYVDYESQNPEQTASSIATRLTSRMEDPSSLSSLQSFVFGGGN